MSVPRNLNRWMVRVSQDLLPIIQQIAREEDRTEPDVARLLIREGCRYRGLVPDPKWTNNNNVEG
jgi:hypothetical protein